MALPYGLPLHRGVSTENQTKKSDPYLTKLRLRAAAFIALIWPLVG